MIMPCNMGVSLKSWFLILLERTPPSNPWLFMVELCDFKITTTMMKTFHFKIHHGLEQWWLIILRCNILLKFEDIQVDFSWAVYGEGPPSFILRGRERREVGEPLKRGTVIPVLQLDIQLSKCAQNIIPVYSWHTLSKCAQNTKKLWRLLACTNI